MVDTTKLDSLRHVLLSYAPSGRVLSAVVERGELFCTVERQCIRDFLLFLKEHKRYSFQQLIDLCAVDYLGRARRFEVVYNLLSLTQNLRLTVKIEVAEGELVPTASDVYSAAGWYEREVWDMYGIYFEDHKDLRRILTDYGFVGHPLRKDFPLSGTSEVRYDIEKKAVVYENVSLVQDFRRFEFASPWQGTEYLLPGDEKATK